MSLVLMLSMVILLAAVVLIEFRAIREGDERRRHAPGYALVMGGLVMIGIGIAAALTDEGSSPSWCRWPACWPWPWPPRSTRGSWSADRRPSNTNTAQAEPVRHLFRTGSPLVCETAVGRGVPATRHAPGD